MISPRQPTSPSAHPKPNLRLQAYVWGICILVIGLGTAAWLWHEADSRHDEDLSSLGLALAPEDSAPGTNATSSCTSGKLGVLMDQLDASGPDHHASKALRHRTWRPFIGGCCRLFAFGARHPTQSQAA